MKKHSVRGLFQAINDYINDWRWHRHTGWCIEHELSSGTTAIDYFVKCYVDNELELHTVSDLQRNILEYVRVG